MFWDRVAGVYDIFVNVINGKTHRALRQIVSALIQPGDTVLECACGTGLLSTVIAPRCKELTATDFAPNMLKRAEKNCSAFTNVTFRQADILSLDFPDSAFDKVVAGNVIHLLDEPLKALGELNRVCKPERQYQRLCLGGWKSWRGFQAAVYCGELSPVFSGRRLPGCTGDAGRGPYPLCGGCGDEEMKNGFNLREANSNE